ncbi:MAG TPA: HAMP domain-containing sensor histidine kinase [Actinomycetes bacterium]|nr:HAMP domain-containing sensor histidine kinase [Actinomycetes bacterium]
MADSEGYLEALPDAVVVVAADGRVVHANRAAERLAGGGRDALAGRPLDDALPLRDAAGNAWWACSERLRGLPGVRRVPVRELSLEAGARTIPVELTASFLRDAGGRLVQAVCVLRDVTARRRTEVQRGELISTLSHELRSPLTSVKGFTSTLLHRWDRFSDEQKRHMLATINMDADRVTRLIRELLDVSRIEAGRVELHRQEFDLPAMARGILDRFEIRHERHAFAIGFPDGFPAIYADPDKVEQVLTNLVENAVKFSDGGKVTVAGEATGDAVEVAVRDQGIGIPAGQLPLIFTKFYQRPSSGPPSGTGLGLYIAKGLVEAHGGRIWADSEPGRGTEVRFRLPRVGLELAGLE